MRGERSAKLRKYDALDADLFGRMLAVGARVLLRRRIRQVCQRMRKAELLDRDQQYGQQHTEKTPGFHRAEKFCAGVGSYAPNGVPVTTRQRRESATLRA